jgi:uncharacterized coiled-coil protein SlyX
MEEREFVTEKSFHEALRAVLERIRDLERQFAQQAMEISSLKEQLEAIRSGQWTDIS